MKNLAACVLGAILAPALSCGSSSSSAPSSSPTNSAPEIVSIQVTPDVAQLPFFGDLWANTWGGDDQLYFSFGDGTGLQTAPTDDGMTPGAFSSPWAGAVQLSPGVFHIPPAPATTTDPLWGLFCRTFNCVTPTIGYPISHFTDSGLVVMNGTVPNFNACPASGCLSAVDLPGEPIQAGQWRNDDKVSSLLSVGGILYYAGHDPSVTPEEGYIAASSDKGTTWTKAPGTLWSGASPFKVVMFINMGKNYQLNTDGYVYAMGTPLELDTTFSHPQSVYLARVPVESIATYTAYSYFAGVDSKGDPVWSSSQSEAIPLAGLSTLSTGSAVYHPGVRQYLFLTGVSTPGSVPNPHGTLFAAPQPWGPWSQVGQVPGIHISMFIAKGAGPTSIYYTAAGGTESYSLNIGLIDLQLATSSSKPAHAPRLRSDARTGVQ